MTAPDLPGGADPDQDRAVELPPTPGAVPGGHGHVGAGGADHPGADLDGALDDGALDDEASDDEDEADDDPDDDDPDDEDEAQDPFAALGALFGGGGGANPLAGLLEQAQQMQAGLQDAQRRLAGQTVSGTAGGGLVRATVTGTGELIGLRIDPSVVDPTDVETLADLVVAAVRVATADARALGERAMSGAVPDFGGMDLGGPGGLGGPAGGGRAGIGGMPDFGSFPGFGTVPDLRAIPGAGPLAGPAGDDDDDDDLGPSGRPRT